MNNLVMNDLVEETREGFKIEDLQGATWAFRKLRAIEEKKAEIKAIAEAEKKRIEEWEQQELKAYEGDIAYFEGVLTEYYVSEKAKDKKFKLSTPFGKVTSRKSTKWNYIDEEATKNYVKSEGIPAIRTKEELDKPILKKLCKNGVNMETGEILPGVEVQETETITVKAE